MEILNLVQGSDEWIEKRREYYSASNAPAMMGEEKYISRLQLKNHYKGWISEVNIFTQKIFDEGHASEDSARPIVGLNEFLTLEPIVAVANVRGLALLASYDGAEIEQDLIEITWEHKLYNQDLYENVRNEILEAFYYWQLEHQMLVADITKCLFTCSNGTGELMATMTYESVPERREALIKGWIQFDKEMETHEKTAKKLKVEAVKVKELPELKINVLSEVKSNNLFDYTTFARSYISEINVVLESDQDFEDAKANISHLKKSEDKITEVANKILDGNVNVKTILDELSDLKKQSATKRLSLSKLVTAQSNLKKDSLKLRGKSSHQKNINLLMAGTCGLDLGFAVPDLDIAIKGLSNFESMKSKIELVVANVNIANKDLVEEYLSKQRLANKMIEGYEFLFSDILSIAASNNKDNLIITIENAILKYKAKLEEDKKVIQGRIDGLNCIPKNFKHEPLKSIKEKIKSLENYIVVKDDFGDMYSEALQCVAGAICDLTEMHFNSSYLISEDENAKYDEANKPIAVIEKQVKVGPENTNADVFDSIIGYLGDEQVLTYDEPLATVDTSATNNTSPVIDFDSMDDVPVNEEGTIPTPLTGKELFFDKVYRWYNDTHLSHHEYNDLLTILNEQF